jgi:uncharacterized protein (TIGR03435 family)
MNQAGWGVSEVATIEKRLRRMSSHLAGTYRAPKVALAIAGVAVLATLIVVGLINVPPVRAQAQAVKPRFEVISVKPSTNCVDDGGRGGGGGRRSWSPGRLSLECQTVMSLVRMAYVQFANGKRTPPGLEVPIDGGPAWINSSRYDIDARAEDAPGVELMSGPMMQALLEDRFRLEVRNETRTVPVYELTLAKGGPKLQTAQPGRCSPFDRNHPPRPSEPGKPFVPVCGLFQERGPNEGVYTYGQTMAGLCTEFSVSLDRQVIDKTGLAGAFDIHLELSFDDLLGNDDATAPAVPAIPADPFVAISAAVQKLGLKLVPAKGPGKFLLIDRVERPSEN